MKYSYPQPTSLLILASLIGITSPLDSFAISNIPFARNIAALCGLMLIAWFARIKRGRLRLTTQAQRLAFLFIITIFFMELIRFTISDFTDFTGKTDILKVFLLFMTWGQAILLFLVLVDVAKDPRSFRYSLFGLVAVMSVLAVAVVLRIPGIAAVSESGRWSPLDMNENEAGFLFSLSLIAILWRLLYQGHKSLKVFFTAGVIAFLLAVALITTGSRGSTLGAIFGVLVLLLLTFNFQRMMIYMIAIPIIIFLGITFGLDTYLIDISEPIVNRFIAAAEGRQLGMRDQIWAVAWPLFLDKPIFGYGLQASYAIGEELFGAGRLAAHNSFFTLTLSFGIIGFFLWTIIYLSVLRGLWRNRRHPVTILFLALFAAISVSIMFGDMVRNKYYWIILALGVQAPYWIKTYPEFFSAYGRKPRQPAARRADSFGAGPVFRGRP